MHVGSVVLQHVGTIYRAWLSADVLQAAHAFCWDVITRLTSLQEWHVWLYQCLQHLLELLRRVAPSQQASAHGSWCFCHSNVRRVESEPKIEIGPLPKSHNCLGPLQSVLSDGTDL